MCVLEVLWGLAAALWLCVLLVAFSLLLFSRTDVLGVEFVGGFVHTIMAALVPVDAADVGTNAVLGNHQSLSWVCRLAAYLTMFVIV